MPAPYAFDQTGLLANNLIVGEVHSVSSLFFRNFNYVIPNLAPFYIDNLIVHLTVNSTTTQLFEGTDYTLSMLYVGASRSVGKNIYGAIVLNSAIGTGTITLSYQTIGGPWVADRALVVTNLANMTYNPKEGNWDNVTNVQTTFPTISHGVPYDSVVGQAAIMAEIALMAQSITARPTSRISFGGLAGPSGLSVFTLNRDPIGSDGINGEGCINGLTGDVFNKVSNAWVKLGNLKGNQGAPGLGAGALTATTDAQNSALVAANAVKGITDYNLALSQINANNLVSPPSVISGFNGNVTASFLYDTSLDYKQGAWLNQCQSKTWYNETTLATGKWLGYLASNTAAWAMVGATLGDYYYNTTDHLFYALVIPSSSAVIVRGSRKDYPALNYITIEPDRIVIWDALDGSMWRIFNQAFYPVMSTWSYVCVKALDGVIMVGLDGIYGGLLELSLVGDYCSFHRNNMAYSANKMPFISNTTRASTIATYTDYMAIDTYIKRVDTLARPDAPINIITGLPVLTVAVVNNAGVQLFLQNGTSIIKSFGVALCYSCMLQGDSVYVVGVGPDSNYGEWEWNYVTNTTKQYGTGNTIKTIPYLNFNNINRNIAKHNGLVIHGSDADGVGVYLPNPSTPTNASVANITSKYNTGVMKGDIRRSWMCDTLAEVISGINLITGDSATFAATLGAWVVGGNATQVRDVITFPSGGIKITSTGGGVTQNTTLAIGGLIVGNAYKITADAWYPSSNSAGGRAVISLEPQPYVGTTSDQVVTANTITSLNISFIATAATATLHLINLNRGVALGSVGDVAIFDNITLTTVIADRCVKAKPLSVIGSITKAPAALGAQTMVYSGFADNTNYLMEPYSTDLDTGTGDFSYYGWFAKSNLGTAQIVLDRGLAGTNRVHLAFNGGAIVFVFGGITHNTVSDATIPANVPYFYAITRVNGVVTLYFNNQVIYTFTDTTTSLTYVAPIFYGVNYLGTGAGISWLSKCRISATGLTPDDVAEIYALERPMFNPGVKVCLGGVSNAITGLSSDVSTDTYIVITPTHVTELNGLIVASTYTTPIASPSTVSANAGYRLIGSPTGTVLLKPALNLYEPKKLVVSPMTQVPANQSFVALAGQTDFPLPIGLIPTADVYAAGVFKYLGAGKDYVIIDTRIRKTIRFNVGLALNTVVDVFCVRA